MKKIIAGALLIILAYLIYVLVGVTDDALYMRRFIFWNFSDIKDYEKFPAIPVKNNPHKVWKLHENNKKHFFEHLEFKLNNREEKFFGNIDSINEKFGTTAFIILKNDTVLYEKYYNDYNRESINTSFSSAKSFTSALIGIAIQKGFIYDINEPITNYLPEYSTKNFQHLTIKDLLLMNSGIDYSNPKKPIIGDIDLWWNHRPRVYYYPNLRKLIENDAHVDTSFIGKYFFYNDYYPVLMGLILEKATKKNAAQLLEEWIWKPSGMEFEASWSIDSEASKVVKMESGINAKAIDFARFGLLFLNEGIRNSDTIIYPQWVKQSTLEDENDNRPWLTTPERKKQGVYYKYQWWGESKKGYYMASGHLGQYIMVFPEKKLVIVRNGKSRADINWWPDIMVQISKQL